jgi:hypothetical protein
MTFLHAPAAKSVFGSLCYQISVIQLLNNLWHLDSRIHTGPRSFESSVFASTFECFILNTFKRLHSTYGLKKRIDPILQRLFSQNAPYRTAEAIVTRFLDAKISDDP